MADKLRPVAATRQPGAPVAAGARQHGVSTMTKAHKLDLLLPWAWGLAPGLRHQPLTSAPWETHAAYQ